MGIVIRQSLWVSFFSYLGIVLGYINIIFLLPRFLDVDQIGSIRFIQGTAALLVQFAHIGLAQTILRYYPVFTRRFSDVRGFIPTMLLAAVGCFLVFLAVFLLFEERIWTLFSEHAPEARHYGSLILLLIFLMSMQAIMDAYSRSRSEVVIVNLLRDLGLRLMMTLIITGYALDFYDFTGFLQLIVGTYSVNLVVLTIYLYQKGLLHFTLNFSFWKQTNYREIIAFSLLTFLGSSGSSIFRRIDSLMVTSLLGLYETGIYTTMFNIVLVIDVPMMAITQVSQPIIAVAFAEHDLTSVKELYRQSSLHQQLAGSLVLIGIIANLPSLFAIMPNGAAFGEGYWVVIILGAAKLIDMSFGINSEIINLSRYYWFNVVFMTVIALFAVGANRLLIPDYGIEGAALATLATLVLFNLTKVIFIRWKYGFQPFSAKNGLVLLVAGGVLYLALVIPAVKPVWLDMILRSVGITLVYCAAVFWLRISKEANALFWTALRWLNLGSSDSGNNQD